MIGHTEVGSILIETLAIRMRHKRPILASLYFNFIKSILIVFDNLFPYNIFGSLCLKISSNLQNL